MRCGYTCRCGWVGVGVENVCKMWVECVGGWVGVGVEGPATILSF